MAPPYVAIHRRGAMRRRYSLTDIIIRPSLSIGRIYARFSSSRHQITSAGSRQCFGPIRELPAYIVVRWLWGCLFALAVLAWRSAPDSVPPGRFCSILCRVRPVSRSRPRSSHASRSEDFRLPQFVDGSHDRASPQCRCAGGERAPERKGVRRITAWERRVAKVSLARISHTEGVHRLSR
jgi:hypothetical protein